MEKIDYSKFDEKTKDTIKFSAIWNAVAGAIVSVGGSAAVYYFARNVYSTLYSQLGIYGGAYAPRLIDFGSLLGSAIWGAIWGAVAGYIIAKFYPVFMDLQKKFVANKLNTMFKILFWPYAVLALVPFLLMGGFGYMYGGFTGGIIVAVADIIAAYIYAKMMEKNVGKYYK